MNLVLLHTVTLLIYALECFKQTYPQSFFMRFVLFFNQNGRNPQCFLSCFHLLSAPLVLVSVFWIFFNEKLYRSLKSYYFSIETHFVVTEYAYLIPVKCVVLIFAYMACVKYRPMFEMFCLFGSPQKLDKKVIFTKSSYTPPWAIMFLKHILLFTKAEYISLIFIMIFKFEHRFSVLDP